MGFLVFKFFSFYVPMCEQSEHMLDKKIKDKIIKKFQTHKDDTGSSEVQIAILTEEIKELIKHLKTHKHDFSSRRGLLKKVAERRKLLKYLERENPKNYETLTKKLKIKKITREEPAPRKHSILEEEDEVGIGKENKTKKNEAVKS